MTQIEEKFWAFVRETDWCDTNAPDGDDDKTWTDRLNHSEVILNEMMALPPTCRNDSIMKLAAIGITGCQGLSVGGDCEDLQRAYDEIKKYANEI